MDGAEDGGLMSVTDTAVHPTAIVSPRAEIGQGVTIGAYTVVGDDVRVGDGTIVASHVAIEGPTTIGEGNHIYPFVSIGQPPQDLKYNGERTELVIGARNQIREFVTLHRGTPGGGGITRVGDGNLLMAQTHIAHDCIVGNNCILANAATLAGHVTVEDGATVGAYSGIHQFCRVGREAFIGGYSVVVKDALPFARTVGNHAKCYGENAIGLRRRGYDDAGVRRLHRAFRLLLSAGLNTTQAIASIREDEALSGDANVEYLLTFIESSERGVTK
jgi:UDP-N-acetylglucosamine acyltransferase